MFFIKVSTYLKKNLNLISTHFSSFETLSR